MKRNRLASFVSLIVIAVQSDCRFDFETSLLLLGHVCRVWIDSGSVGELAPVGCRGRRFRRRPGDFCRFRFNLPSNF